MPWTPYDATSFSRNKHDEMLHNHVLVTDYGVIEVIEETKDVFVLTMRISRFSDVNSATSIGDRIHDFINTSIGITDHLIMNLYLVTLTDKKEILVVTHSKENVSMLLKDNKTYCSHECIRITELHSKTTMKKGIYSSY
jgi:hypothetical protein